MKNIIAMTAIVACTLTLTACGGGGGDDSSSGALSRADEGIWSNLDSGGQYGMQAVILSDGTYWGVYGPIRNNIFESITADVLQGTANVSGNNVSGTYTDFSDGGIFGVFNGTYSGTVSAQNNISLTFNDPSNMLISTSPSINMSYDGIYNQTVSLSVITGNYLGYYCEINPDAPSPGFCSGSNSSTNLTVLGSSLTLQQVGNATTTMTGTIAPHGTGTVNVFDVSFTSAAPPGTTGTTYKGILFQTSSGNTEIIAAAENGGYFYLGTKQN
ncbi:MAG: hypothetical protein LBH10_01665 [Burkholderiaceae bacterium]|nr:hypothetical protein [Burkholderiaceae bacterium]